MIEIVKQPTAIPGCCFLCGGVAERDWFVDTGASLDGYGAVFFCSVCFAAAADIVGYLTPAQATELKQERLRLREENENLLIENQKLEIALRELLNSSSFNGSSNISDVSSSVDLRDEDHEVERELAPVNTAGSVEESTGTVGPDSVSELGDIFNLKAGEGIVLDDIDPSERTG